MENMAGWKRSMRLMISVLALLSTSIAVSHRWSVLHEDLRQMEITIPLGTYEAIKNGLPAADLPHEIELVLGVRDVLVIHNNDTSWHQVGPYQVAPGRTLIQRFYRPVTIEEYCTMVPEQEVKIIVRERY